MSDIQQRRGELGPVWLRPADQQVIAIAALIGTIVLAGLWLSHGGLTGRLTDIEQLPQRDIDFQLDINTADWAELALLPDVGQTLAKRIVQSRVEQGPFGSIEDLRRVRGIGPKTLQRIRPHLRPIAPATRPAAQEADAPD